MPSIGVNLRVTGHCSQGGRKYMEDFFSVAYQQSFVDEHDLEYAFIGIYDGHGGSDAAQFAKEHLINLIVNQKAFWSDDDADVLRAIKEGYIATHYAMWREQEKWPKTATGLPSTAGTTASVAFIRHGKIYIGHCGDSGIVLGYQEDGERHWRSKPLTEDHKPESDVEKERIMNSGGKVMVKAGVPRVVWNRPRLGHKGPVRRSTPIDEIPFLAVARSLGDLWSYNSALDEFVVSPNPDVCVIKIDPKRFKCLVFGTDGLWNVVTAQGAIESIRQTELLNERSSELGECKEWTNPSKNLVDKALERWSTRKMRADNTSVVVIILDPPGPAKRDLMKSSTSHDTYPMQDYLQPADQIDDQPPQHLEIEPLPNFTIYDHRTHEHINLDTIPLTVMTRYENITDDHPASFTNHLESADNDLQYMNMDSFAESYNSLLNSNIGNDQMCDPLGELSDDYMEYSYDDMNETHQYNMDNSYSLTRLQTRYEQTTIAFDKSLPSTSHSMYANYKHNLIDHSYIAGTSYSDESDYAVSDNNANAINDTTANATKSPATKKSDKSDHRNNGAANHPRKTDKVQINEVTSSKLMKLGKLAKSTEQINTKETRKTLTVDRQTRSASTNKKNTATKAAIKNSKTKLSLQMSKRTEKMGRKHRKENISVVHKVPVVSLFDRAIVDPIRTRHSTTIKSRTLRSQNVLAKESTSRTQNHRTATSQMQHTSKIIPKISQSSTINHNNHSGKATIVKKMPKRLPNGTVQIDKTSNSIRQSAKSNEPDSQTSSLGSRRSAVLAPSRTVLKALEPKKSLITVERCNQMMVSVRRSTINTRHMRSQK